MQPAFRHGFRYVRTLAIPLGRTQDHIAEYGKQRLFTLVEVAAEFNKVKRGAKNDLLERIESYEAGRAF